MLTTDRSHNQGGYIRPRHLPARWFAVGQTSGWRPEKWRTVRASVIEERHAAVARCPLIAFVCSQLARPSLRVLGDRQNLELANSRLMLTLEKDPWV